MTFIDRLKGTAKSLGVETQQLKEMAVDAVDKHGDKITSGIDKAAEAANKATKGKYEHQIAKGVGKAKEGVDKVGSKKHGDTIDGDTNQGDPGAPTA